MFNTGILAIQKVNFRLLKDLSPLTNFLKIQPEPQSYQSNAYLKRPSWRCYNFQNEKKVKTFIRNNISEIILQTFSNERDFPYFDAALGHGTRIL